MKMKLFLRSVILMMMLTMALPGFSAVPSEANTTDRPAAERAEVLTKRLEEIRGMDVKKLSRKEKKALRGEVKAIKKEMAAISGGVYLSVGAIILIVLLIILLA